MIELDEIGTLYKAVPFTALGQTLQQPEALPGWHVNATAPVPGWDAWRTHPTTPRREFSGVATVHYSFDDEAKYRAALAVADLDPPAPPAVPQTVTMRQARLALLGAGLLPLVDDAINALPDPLRTAARIEWDYSNEVHRDKPFVQMLGTALGLTGEQLDALFIEAAQL